MVRPKCRLRLREHRCHNPCVPVEIPIVCEGMLSFKWLQHGCNWGDRIDVCSYKKYILNFHSKSIFKADFCALEHLLTSTPPITTETFLTRPYTLQSRSCRSIAEYYQYLKITFDEYSCSCSACTLHECERSHNGPAGRIQIHIPLPSGLLHQGCAGDSSHGERRSNPSWRWHPTSWPPGSCSGEIVESVLPMEHVGCRWALSQVLGPDSQKSRGFLMHVCRGQRPV